jgi:hypothetical protein
MNPGKRVKIDSSFGRGDRLQGEQEVELELEFIADFLKVRKQLAEFYLVGRSRIIENFGLEPYFF